MINKIDFEWLLPSSNLNQLHLRTESDSNRLLSLTEFLRLKALAAYNLFGI